MYRDSCSHLDQIKAVKPHTDGCEECLKLGAQWVHLRLCLTCGHVGCCDSSEGKHATKHFHSKHHPIIQSLEPGEEWKWCFVDQVAWE
ncbi:MAG: UBP-type zinc finger domain-containing protein [Acidobacteria bacterium]|nr:UBP-type zinc finger domain-containing protein [Acidobacteriota bacterium]